jgi:hypothetical protein
VLVSYLWYSFQERMEVGFDFCLRNQNTLQLRQHGFVRDNNGRGIVIRLGRDDVGIFMLNGALIAEKFQLAAPTRARFEYMGPLNMFMITFLPNENDAANNREVANNAEVVQEVVNDAEAAQEVANNAEMQQEVIDISSDEEVHISSDEEEEIEEMQEVEDLHHFYNRRSQLLCLGLIRSRFWYVYIIE